MLHELVDESTPAEPEAFLESYLSALRAIVQEVGRERAIEAEVDPEAVDALAADEGPDLTVTEASRLLALDETYPDAETIRAEALDHLLLGMTTAVLDVDTVAANLALDVSPTGVQQRVEGRAEMTVAEYAHVHALIADRKR